MNYWCDADGKLIDQHALYDELSKYIDMGGKVYVGADSMLRSEKCHFACAIALHDRNLNIAKYYFKKTKKNSKTFKNLQSKIMSEVSLAIEAAVDIREKFPNVNLEIHVDVGQGERNATKPMVGQIRGWLSGLGFCCKIKPHSWASSDIADWHTK